MREYSRIDLFLITFVNMTKEFSDEDQRNAQKAYWAEHSTEATVEAMMLDSHACEIDKLERPEVRDPSIHEASASKCLSKHQISDLYR